MEQYMHCPVGVTQERYVTAGSETLLNIEEVSEVLSM